MKNKFIMLIGSDGAGKSTIAEGLHDLLGYPVEHHGPVKSHNEGFNEYFGCIENTEYSVIKDRFFEGEKIFAPLYRGYQAEYFTDLERYMMSKFDVMLVLVTAPFEVIEKRLEDRGEDFVLPEHFKYAYDKVIDIYNESILPKMVIDTDFNSLEVNLNKIYKNVTEVYGL